LASEHNHPWLRDRGALPVAYGDGQAERIRQAASGHVDAFIDTFGSGYVDLAVELGVPVDRINTIIDFAAVERLGVHSQGTHAIATSELLGDIIGLVADGTLEVPIARTYPLAEVREAFRELAKRKTHGKIVLLP
jgi:NADPH:quinone reductase-like Zn-dependent oxidoreductase